MDKKQERVIALAAVFECAYLVAQLAKNGQCDNDSTITLMQSLFVFNPENTTDVYDNKLDHLVDGLTTISTLSSNRPNDNTAEVIRYGLSILALQKQLDKNPQMLDIIRARLNHLEFNKTHFSNDPHQIFSSVSGLYQDTLSTLKFRIQVNGNMNHLKQTSISDKVRTLLFAGIRSAMLWRQLGGNKWQIIFGRSDIENISKELLLTLSKSKV